MYDESETIDLKNVPLNGGYLLKVLVVSVDPYLRGKMRIDSPYAVSIFKSTQFLKLTSSIPGLFQAWTAVCISLSNLLAHLECSSIACRIYNLGVGVVLRSELQDVKPGDHIYGFLRKHTVMHTHSACAHRPCA